MTITNAAGTSNAVSANHNLLAWPFSTGTCEPCGIPTARSSTAQQSARAISWRCTAGFGPTNSTVTTCRGIPAANTVTVTLDGSPAEVLWAGLVGPGLYQINIRVPASLSDGDKTVVAAVGGLSSPPTAKLRVAASAKLA